MICRLLIVILACLLYAPAISAQDRKQKLDDEMPRVSELLDQASEHIESLEPDLGQAYLYRQLAALYARAQDVDSAYRVLGKIQIPKSQYPQTAENLRRVGFLELVEDVALHRDTETALKIVNECPDEFRVYRDDAFGRIALSAAHRRDSEGARKAIDEIKQPQGLYPYELVVAATLDDKARGKRILLEQHKDVIDAIEGSKFMSREQWAGILWMLSFYKWCDLKDEFKELVNAACETTDNPDESRAAFLEDLEKADAVETDASDDDATKNQVTRMDIAKMAASVEELKSPKQKAERLLAIAKHVLEFGRKPIAGNCD